MPNVEAAIAKANRAKEVFMCLSFINGMACGPTRKRGTWPNKYRDVSCEKVARQGVNQLSRLRYSWDWT